MGVFNKISDALAGTPPQANAGTGTKGRSNDFTALRSGANQPNAEAMSDPGVMAAMAAHANLVHPVTQRKNGR